MHSVLYRCNNLHNNLREGCFPYSCQNHYVHSRNHSRLRNRSNAVLLPGDRLLKRWKDGR